MNLQDVRRELSELLSRLPPRMEDDSWIDSLAKVQRMQRDGSAGGLVNALRDWPGSNEFAGLRRHFGRSAHSVDLDELAEWLLLRAREHDVDTACDELLTYGEEPDYPAVFTLPLAGLQLTKPLDVGNGVRILPFTPEFFEDLGYLDADAVAFDRTREGMKEISCVAVLKERHPKILTPPADPPAISPEASEVDAHIYERLNAARLMCGLVRPRDISIAGHHARILMSVPCHLRAAYGGYRLSGHSLAYGYVYEDFAEAVKPLHEAYSNLPEDWQRRLTLALERVQSAIHEQHRLVDSSIDLGIALESLFLEDDDSSELSYRLSVRAARVLTTDATERVEARRLFKAVYALRSRAVHRGKADLRRKELGGRSTVEDLLRDGIEATSRAARKIIERGALRWSDFDLS